MVQKYFSKHSFNILSISFFVFLSTNIHGSSGLIRVNEQKQTMTGFGASIAWYENWLYAHPYKSDIYEYIFKDLGIDILRLKNNFRYGSGSFNAEIKSIVGKYYQLSEAKPQILITSWSPPASLKSNNSTENGGTLKKVNGKYVYGEFAKYWVDALEAFDEIGINPDYISIQNEPSFVATWESCILRETESAEYAGYNIALDSVYAAFSKLDNPPKIIGPEVLGIGYNHFQKYADKLNRDHLDAYAYHLYHGESDNVNDNHNADLFINNLSAIGNKYNDKPIFETEYDRGDWFNTVKLIHNALVYGNVSAYLYWPIVWSNSGGLFTMENPWNRSSWTTPRGYIIPKVYWAFRQYSKFIDAGWKRVSASYFPTSIKASAFINPEENKLTIVLINTASQAEEITLSIDDFNITSGEVVRTSEYEDGEVILDSYDGNSPLELPENSITTISIEGNKITGTENDHVSKMTFKLFQNYPNPFNPVSNIKYQIENTAYVRLSVYDVLGREVSVLVDEIKAPGIYEVMFDASVFSSGVYYCKLDAGKESAKLKMMLVK